MATELLSYGNHQLSTAASFRGFQASSRARFPVIQRLSCNSSGVPRRHLRGQLWENAAPCPPQDKTWNAEESYSSLQVQTLRDFPKEQLYGKVVLVRFDSRILLKESQTSNFPTDKACFTINYLHSAGAKVILTSSWGHNEGSGILSNESAADYLSDLLQLRVTVPGSICGVIHSQIDGQRSGWKPVDIGPKTLQELSSLLLKGKDYTVFRIGPAHFDLSQKVIDGELSLNSLLCKIVRDGCCAIVVGAAACRGIINATKSQSVHYMFDGASVMWKLLKGRNLPGVAALDKACPLVADWGNIFSNPSLPLFVDIGSGNGLFLFRMSGSWKNKNFLGLEINNKLVTRCLDTMKLSNSKNLHFINANATTTFRLIVSRYKGMLSFVSIQCPNPQHHSIPRRWKVLQRPLVEAVADLLPLGAKVFLQSDIEKVASKMKDQFIVYSKGRLAVHYDEIGVDVDSDGWLMENPFGIRSDWEQHVIDRGGSMYRIMLAKVSE